MARELGVGIIGCGNISTTYFSLGDRVMRIRDRQIDDDVDLVIGQKFIDGLCLDAIFGGPGF